MKYLCVWVRFDVVVLACRDPTKAATAAAEVKKKYSPVLSSLGKIRHCT